MRIVSFLTLAVSFCFASVVFAASPGISEKEILIGTSQVLDGPASFLGIQTNHGMNALISSVNDKGGINGRKIRVIAYNDKYEPVPCAMNTKKLIETDKVFALTSYIGTPTSVKSQPIWTAAKVPVVGFFTGASALRNPFNRYNIHIRGSYEQEAAAIVDVFVNKLNFRKIAVFYQNDSFGEAVKKAAETAMAKHGMAPVAYGNYQRNTLNTAEGLKAIAGSNPDAVIMVGTYAPLAKFVKEAKAAGMAKTVFHTVSFVGPEAFAKELGDKSERCVITQVVPPYEGSSLPIIAEYKDNLKKYYPDDAPNFVSLEGYLNAKILAEGIKRAGKNLSRESFIDAIESIKHGQLGTGLSFSYGPSDHEGIGKIYLTEISGGKLFEVNDWAKFR
ncbi:MAG: hypothetical protein A2251_06460 [Elusimicrobia bacterium RIFOXYA2_FULL_47_53]|nr:MAG: hypothetical protein A2251_06460 [Elusimicrobia bacterium RIFOXYA2_FULL_47_53]OGS29661.1 MAG: hypothetical protein A2323_03680 [Elusimicrobia bacterium RIFOXYB2_FULL_46_23]